MIYKMKLFHSTRSYILFSLIVLLCFFGCQQNTSKDDTEKKLEIQSFFELYPEAENIALDWNKEAELTFVETFYFIASKKIAKHSLTFIFVANDNTENLFIVKCINQRCTGEVETREHTHFYSTYTSEYGFDPIIFDEVKQDNKDAWDIQMNHQDYIINKPVTIKISLMNMQCKQYWEIVKVGEYPTVHENVDAYSGEVIKHGN